MFAFELTDSWRGALTTGGKVVLVVVVAFVGNALARRAITRMADRMGRATTEVRGLAGGRLVSPESSARALARATTVGSVLRSATSVAIYTFAALVVLGQLRINLGPLIAGAGVASIAVGFGAQSLVRDVLAGLFVVAEDQYGVGDIVDAGSATGTVERVTLRSTQLRDGTGTVWHIPNGSITRVGNKSQNMARAIVDVTVAHGGDVARTRQVLRDAVAAAAADTAWAADRLAGEPDEQGVQAVTPDGITMRVVAETFPLAQASVERELRERICAAFAAEGIALADWSPRGSAP